MADTQSLQLDQENLRRRQIMEAVMECVAEAGIEGATMRRVAEKLGVSTGMLTHYYASKKDLIAATFDTASAVLSEVMDRVLGQTLGAERLGKAGDLMLSNRAEDVPPVAFWIAFWSEATREPDLQQRFVQLRLRNRSANQRSLQAAIHNGEFRDDLDTGLAADLLSALVYGLRIHTALGGPSMDPQRAMQIYSYALDLLRPVHSLNNDTTKGTRKYKRRHHPKGLAKSE